jgi:glycosyltransferase involved in cell wall biosynthesis
MLDVTTVIVAKDEERTIGQVLSAARTLSDQIILVDSGSSDRTLTIARQSGVSCYEQEWLGYAAQKNYAISLAQSNWILSLDADEVLSPELVAEIKQVLAKTVPDQVEGFKIPRRLYIGVTAITHGGYYPDAQLRLFRRGKGLFNDRKVHEAVQVKGKVQMLENAMLHYAYPDFDAYAKAMDKYARLSAEEFAKRSSVEAAGPLMWWRTSRLNEALHPLWTLFFRFICRGGFLDGESGLTANLIYRDYVRKKIVYLRELLVDKR